MNKVIRIEFADSKKDNADGAEDYGDDDIPM